MMINRLRVLMIILALMAGSISLLNAQTKDAQTKDRSVEAKLDEATIFLKGAELQHITSKVDLTRGASSLLITGLSPNIDQNSIKINATNGVVVSSFYFSRNHLAAERQSMPKVKMIEDSIKIYQAALDKINIEYNINQQQMQHLQSGIEKSFSGSTESALSVEQLIKAMDYHKQKANELAAINYKSAKKRDEISTRINVLNSQLSQERTKNTKVSGELTLFLSSPFTGQATFTVSYFTQQASWLPYYDINIPSTDKPISLAYKAKVRQTTGLDWERVKITLSTSKPSSGKIAPVFNTWFLREYRAVYPTALRSQKHTTSSASVDYADEQMMESVVVRGSGSANSHEPLYILNGVPSTQAEVESIDPTMIKSFDVLKGDQATSVYGSRASAGVMVITTKEMVDFVNQSESALSTVYNIDIPYSIPGNGIMQNIDLQVKQTPAEYKYYSAPKLDSEAYVLAEISNWQALGLLSGSANITYAGTYLGETVIDANSTREKLSLTLGTDNRIAIKREALTDYSSSRFLGSNVVTLFGYKITVKNNQNIPAKVIIKEQYPVSTAKNIEVELQKETTQWSENDSKTGVITWESEFAPGQSKEYIIQYSVKRPKDMNLDL